MKNLIRRLTVLTALGLFALTACRGSGSKESSGPGLLGSLGTDATPVARQGDPLFGDRIPKQNLPTRSGEAIGARGLDPLFGLPPGGDKPPVQRAGQQEDKGSASRNGAFPEPYRPTRNTTNAALATAIAPDDATLSIGPRRLPAALPTSQSSQLFSYEQMVSELRRSGGRVGEPTRENGNYVIRAEVPIDPEVAGPARWYEGVGVTPAAALRQIVDQVRTDKPKN